MKMTDLTKDRPDNTGDMAFDQNPASPESKQPDAGQPASPADTGAEKGNGFHSDDGPEVDARTRANRENAQKSTGPRTDAGRAASSRNAVKHGLFAADVTKYFRSEEESQRYQRFVDGIVNDLAPVGDLETVLAHRAADIQFRLDMLRTAEFKVYSGEALPIDTMEGYLHQLKNPLALASLYDSRFQNSFTKTMKELRLAQQARRDRELHALEQLKGIALSHIQQNATFDPAKFGFVISRDFVFNQAHLASARTMAQFSVGNGVVEKKVVDYVAKVPPKAA